MAGVVQDDKGDASIRFFASVGFAFFGSLFFAVMAGIIGWVAFKSTAEPFLFVAACLGAVFFGALSGLAATRPFYLRGVVLEVGPQGIRDRRLSSALVPWSAVTNIAAVEFVPLNPVEGLLEKKYWRTFLFVQLDPAFEATWRVSLRVRIIRMVEGLFGKSGYFLGVIDLNGASFGDLEKAALRFWQQSKQRS
jgi:hypothetical protein